MTKGVIVLGAKGMLGTDLCAEFARRNVSVAALDRDELDITDPSSILQLGTKGADYDWCINCAAYTAVDKAETEREACFAINAYGAGMLATICGAAGIRVMHISTDFVFDGTAREPYTELSPTRPLGAYGESKLEGEELALSQGAVICRTSWLFGPHGPSFPRTMIRAWLAGKDLRVVADQVGCPTYTGDMARVLVDLVETDRTVRPVNGGIYHVAGEESMSWHELAERAIEAYALEVQGREVTPSIAKIATEDYPTPARRPAYSVLSTDKVKGMGIAPMRPLSETLPEFARRLPKEL